MKRYWSCSKFVDWLRGTPKLHSGTSEEWNAWEKKAKTKKIRYWLVEECLDYVERFVYWPTNLIDTVYCYLNNRWVTKSHALTSNLKRGAWYEFDTRLLHTVFDELVNFVEIDSAWALVASSPEDRKKYKVPWYRIGSWRSPDAGIAYLKWASALKNEDDGVAKNDPHYGQPTYQALAAQETLTLYKWWKEERPKRPDPREASGWSDYCEEKRNAAQACGDDLWDDFIFNTTKDERSRDLLEAYGRIEEEQEEEDTAMLIRLIKIRQSLWT